MSRRCEYIGNNEDQWLSTGERCDQEVTTTVDKDRPSKMFKANKMLNILYPSKRLKFCHYHMNKLKCKKLGVGKQS